MNRILEALYALYLIAYILFFFVLGLISMLWNDGE